MKFRLLTYDHVKEVGTVYGTLDMRKTDPVVYDTENEFGKNVYDLLTSGQKAIQVIEIKEGDPLYEKEVKEVPTDSPLENKELSATKDVVGEAQRQIEVLNMQLAPLLEQKQQLKNRKPKELEKSLNILKNSKDKKEVEAELEKLRTSLFFNEERTREQAIETLELFKKQVASVKSQIASLQSKIRFYEAKLVSE